MIYAKEKPIDAISIIGKERWNKIRKETGKEGGLGHELYEKMRQIDKSMDIDIWRELERQSKEYYSNFR